MQTSVKGLFTAPADLTPMHMPAGRCTTMLERCGMSPTWWMMPSSQKSWQTCRPATVPQTRVSLSDVLSPGSALTSHKDPRASAWECGLSCERARDRASHSQRRLHSIGQLLVLADFQAQDLPCRGTWLARRA